MIEVTGKELDVAAVIDSVRRPDAGAIAVFIGTVRREEGLEGLDVRSYEEMAIERMGAVRELALSGHGALEASIVHRVGRTGIGDDLVAIAASAPHRDGAFAACRFIIDELKATVPFWKLELGRGAWVEGTPMREPGAARPGGMVDVGPKPEVPRAATAEGFIDLTPASVGAIRSRSVRKGDVLEVARVAAIMGAKQTPAIVPHCHPVPLTAIDVDLEVRDDGVRARCLVRADYRTGVEMEALTGVSCALLTVWDMVKYLEKDAAGQYPATRIRDVRVLEKVKGEGRPAPGGG